MKTEVDFICYIQLLIVMIKTLIASKPHNTRSHIWHTFFNK